MYEVNLSLVDLLKVELKNLGFNNLVIDIILSNKTRVSISVIAFSYIHLPPGFPLHLRFVKGSKGWPTIRPSPGLTGHLTALTALTGLASHMGWPTLT